jgi:hypothetical protein
VNRSGNGKEARAHKGCRASKIKPHEIEYSLTCQWSLGWLRRPLTFMEPKIHCRVGKSLPRLRLYATFCYKLIFYPEWLLALRPAPKPEDHPLSAVHIWRTCSSLSKRTHKHCNIVYSPLLCCVVKCMKT